MSTALKTSGKCGLRNTIESRVERKTAFSLVIVDNFFLENEHVLVTAANSWPVSVVIQINVSQIFACL